MGHVVIANGKWTTHTKKLYRDLSSLSADLPIQLHIRLRTPLVGGPLTDETRWRQLFGTTADRQTRSNAARDLVVKRTRNAPCRAVPPWSKQRAEKNRIDTCGPETLYTPHARSTPGRPGFVLQVTRYVRTYGCTGHDTTSDSIHGFFVGILWSIRLYCAASTASYVLSDHRLSQKSIN